MKSRKKSVVLLAVSGLAFFLSTCTKTDSTKSKPQSGGPFPTLLIAQAQFIYEKKGDSALPKPGPALLTILQKTPAGWKAAVIDDPQSNVFHKALFFKDAKGTKIVTVGAMEAALKFWEWRGFP